MRRTRRNEDPGWSPSFTESCWGALFIGLLIFLRDWSGYTSRFVPFYPRSLREIWWHLPLQVVFAFIFIQLARLLDWSKRRSLVFWIAYTLLIIVVAVALAWMVMILSD